MARGYKLASGGTENHLLIVDFRNGPAYRQTGRQSPGSRRALFVISTWFRAILASRS